MSVVIVLACVSAVLAVCCAVLCVHGIRSREAGAAAEAEAARLRAEVESARLLAQAGEENCRKRLEDKEEACRQRLAAMEATCVQQAQQTAETLRVQFAHLAQQHLKASSEGLSELNRRRLDELMAPFQAQLKEFRQAFEDDKRQQVANKASFEQAISDLGKRALQIGADAENLAKALKRESKTQGDWGEMVLGNILAAAGLKEGRDYFPQAQEVDAQGGRLIPDVEIPLPNKEKLLIDSKASVTAYLDYVAAADEVAREAAAKAHVASVRKHMEELADKDYIKRVKGSQGYILMFIPNEGSYLLAMDRDRKLATDAFRRHVIIVNPTTLLLCVQIVALLRSRETQNENAERISAAAAKMYEKFATFSATFADVGKRLDGLSEAYRKANGQLCAGPGNVIRQMESLKAMGVVTTKSVDSRLLEEAGAES
ncbi:MAG: DNA recombination protein RmuC [Kiritimatiellia bacterium]